MSVYIRHSKLTDDICYNQVRLLSIKECPLLEININTSNKMSLMDHYDEAFVVHVTMRYYSIYLSKFVH